MEKMENRRDSFGISFRETVQVTRFCLVEDENALVLAEVSTKLGENGINIVSNTSRRRGSLCFQVLDLELRPDQLNDTQKLIEAIPGVVSCSIGSFSPESGAIYHENAPIRLCIVTVNAPGLLGKVSSIISSNLGLKIVSHINRSREKIAYNVFDVENTNADWDVICRTLELTPQVYSCNIGHFKTGDLANLGKKFSSTLSTYSLDTGDSEAEDNVSIKSTSTTGAGRSSSLRPASFVRTLSYQKDSVRNLAATPEEAWGMGEKLEVKVKRRETANSESDLLTPRSESQASESDYYGDGSKGTTRSRKLTIMSERTSLTKDAAKLVIVMVGLPARGKSFTARKLKRFLNWKNRSVKIFNAGRYRRERTVSTDSVNLTTDRADFFKSGNEEGKKVRQEAADRALKDMLAFLSEDDSAAVAIFDATNSTHGRRVWITDQCKDIASVVFVEVICDDEEVLNENLLAKIRSSPDFAGMDEATALEDLRVRIANYEDQYEPLSDDNMSYIKLYNMSTKIMANRIYGRLARSILPYMLSLHIALRPIWFVRAGLAEDSRISLLPEYDLLDPSTESKASKLSDLGVAFSKKLASWIQTALWLRDNGNEDGETMVQRELSTSAQDSLQDPQHYLESQLSAPSKDACDPRKMFERCDDEVVVRRGDGTRATGAVLKVLCSTLPRAEQTAQIALSSLNNLNEAEPCPMLNPLDKGELAGLSMEQIKANHAEFYKVWSQDKYAFRFPGGESYLDLVTRLEPVLIEIEQQTAPILVVSHVSCIQTLLSYYLGIPVQQAMKIRVPMHKVIEVSPTIGGSWEMNLHDV